MFQKICCCFTPAVRSLSGIGGINTTTINLLADTYNIVVGNLGKGSSNPSDSAGQKGTDSYIQGSSLVIAIAYAGGGGNSTQPDQNSGSTHGIGGGPIAGGYGGKGGFSTVSGGAGGNAQSSNLSPYSGGGGGGCGSTCCGGTSASNGIGGIQGCATNITGSNGSDAISYGGGGGGGSVGGSGGNGYYGVIIFVI